MLKTYWRPDGEQEGSVVAKTDTPQETKMLKTHWRPDGEHQESLVATTDRHNDLSLVHDSSAPRLPPEGPSSLPPRGEDVVVRDRHVEPLLQVEPTLESVSVSEETKEPEGRWRPSRDDELL
jgi:hypothetical protein